MVKILVLHGPNLNLLGIREPDIYGDMSLDELNDHLVDLGNQLSAEVRTFQSNHEGELIGALQEARNWAHGVVFNPAGYSHTSVALRDTVAGIDLPVIEVHLHVGDRVAVLGELTERPEPGWRRGVGHPGVIEKRPELDGVHVEIVGGRP